MRIRRYCSEPGSGSRASRDLAGPNTFSNVPTAPFGPSYAPQMGVIDSGLQSRQVVFLERVADQQKRTNELLREIINELRVLRRLAEQEPTDDE